MPDALIVELTSIVALIALMTTYKALIMLSFYMVRFPEVCSMKLQSESRAGAHSIVVLVRVRDKSAASLVCWSSLILRSEKMHVCSTVFFCVQYFDICALTAAARQSIVNSII